MRLLFQLDTRDYDPNGKAFVRPSVRGIIIRAGKVGMVHSQKYDYYKFPGGGVEAGESRHQALSLGGVGNVRHSRYHSRIRTGSSHPKG